MLQALGDECQWIVSLPYGSLVDQAAGRSAVGSMTTSSCALKFLGFQGMISVLLKFTPQIHPAHGASKVDARQAWTTPYSNFSAFLKPNI